MRIGIQLFSLRKYLQDTSEFPKVFAKVRAMGAECVQVSGTAPFESAFLKSVAEKTGLYICATHSPFTRIRDNLSRLAQEHSEYGCPVIGIGMMPKEYRQKGVDGYKEFADFLTETAAKLESTGVKIAYHNHAFEFQNMFESTGYDYLIENTPTSVQFIPDTFWIRAAGYSPAEYIKKLNGRIAVLHLKDYKKALFLPVMTAIGKGTLDFKEILTAAETAQTTDAVVELDISPNPYKSLDFSMQYLKKHYMDKTNVKRSYLTKSLQPVKCPSNVGQNF